MTTAVLALAAGCFAYPLTSSRLSIQEGQVCTGLAPSWGTTKWGIQPQSSFGGRCCSTCSEGKYICCPTVDTVTGEETKIKLDNTEYHRANLCCEEKQSDTTCTAEAKQAIIMDMHDPGQQVHLVITNASSYYPVMPQYELDKKGNPDKGVLSKSREGWVGNGEKNEGEFSDGLIQINQCNNKVMTAQVCFASVDNNAVYMKKARLRIFDIDMGTDPNRLGPEAVQFHCPGGTFEVYGDTPPYVSWNAGHPIRVQTGDRKSVV